VQAQLATLTPNLPNEIARSKQTSRHPNTTALLLLRCCLYMFGLMNSLPRAKCRALGKERFAESRPSATVGRRQNHICRGPGRRQRIPLGNWAFCRGPDRRQRKVVGKSLSLPRSGSWQNMVVRKPVTTGKRPSPVVYFAEGQNLALDKELLCRVSFLCPRQNNFFASKFFPWVYYCTLKYILKFGAFFILLAIFNKFILFT
jgi:hypothetical protein